MKRFLLIGLAAVGLLVALVVALPFLIPLSAYRSQIETRATTSTGRVVKIDGPLRISFFPVLGLRANNVTVANAAGRPQQNLAQVDVLEVAVALRPLLDGDVEITDIHLVRPQIHLEVDEQGHSNWKLATAANRGSTFGRSRAVHFAEVIIEDGSLTYSNAKTRSQRSVDHLAAEITMPAGGRLAANGSLEEHGKPVTFEAELDNADALGAGASTRARLALSSDLFHANFLGKVSGDGDADGDLLIDTSSLRELAGLFGHPLAAAAGLGRFALKSRVVAHATAYTLTNLSFSLDAINATGELAIDTTRDVPDVSGSLVMERLDLNPYVGSSPSEVSGPGWSRKPLSLSFLNDVDGDLKINATSLEVRRLKIANANLAVVLHGGKLDASLVKFSLYGGIGDAVLHADTTGSIPTFANRAVFNNIQMAPFLSDTIGITKINGTGTIRLNASSAGQSASDVMHAMTGAGSVAIHNGAIRGVDLGLVARTVQTVLNGGATSEGATTRFSNLGGTFVIRNGVLSNRDLALSGPVITARGQGQLDLGNRTIDFHIAPKAGVGSAIGLSVPIHVSGTWDHLRYATDLAGAVGGVFGGLAQGGSALGGLFTGSSQSGSQKKNSSVGDSVKTLFGIH